MQEIATDLETRAIADADGSLNWVGMGFVSRSERFQLQLIVGGWWVMEGNLSIGMLIAFQGLMHNLLDPVTDLLNFGSTLQTLDGDINRLDNVLENAVDPIFSQQPKEDAGRQGSRLRGFLELRQITFGYFPVAPPLIEGFSLSLQPGQRVAIAGKSGSGKSTIAKLICGLYSNPKWVVKFCLMVSR